ncbi:hypothetical protein G7Y89_g8601 [Cudoniella acicularis]|uniref:Cytochrome P450 n=1 Tax=Cudoniella acicularis TaxID=354080 RepID=A0A8H4W0X2_9HELO|nr:hypothetical protein G7Y89_g8601 [Cudoniella acicularis]
MSPLLRNALPTSFAAGVLSFLTYFMHGEHHLHVVLYIQLFVGSCLASLVILTQLQQCTLSVAMTLVYQVGVTYLAGLYLSRAFYRLLLSPLNRFPGSKWARLTSFWLPWQNRRSDCFRQLKHLHDTFGPIVRIGPNNLSVAHHKAVQVIYGQGSLCTKAAWYDLTRPMVSLQTFRDSRLHTERRRVWSIAFGDKALRGYEQRLKVYREQLMLHLTESEGQPVNVTRWFNLYSFDFMGDLAFGKPFDMLQQGEHWAIQLLTAGLKPLAFAFPVWFFRVLIAIPGLSRDWWRFIDFCAQRMEQRLRTPVEVPDIMSALSAPLKGKQPSSAEMHLLRGDAQLIVVAGRSVPAKPSFSFTSPPEKKYKYPDTPLMTPSDTTATTLSATIFQLAQHPEQIEKLRKELAPYMTEPNGEVLNEKIANLEHLNAIINEVLRLHPPVPSMLQRKTPPEGIDIDGEFIPGNTVVSCPQYVLGRSSQIYEKPEEFIPERWYLQPDLIKEKKAWAPFSTGTYGCIGKPLALLNIRTTLARLVTQYDITFAPGEDGTSFEGKATEKFTINFGDLMISFKKRGD